MDGLQRSAISFRRQGSSGLVWDDKFLSGKLNQTKPKDHQQADEGKRDHRASQMQRSRSNREHTYHTVKDVGPTINPPSPKLSACGFCGMLGNPQTTPKLRSTKLKQNNLSQLNWHKKNHTIICNTSATNTMTEKKNRVGKAPPENATLKTPENSMMIVEEEIHRGLLSAIILLTAVVFVLRIAAADL
ncbi:unnamed protein product [Camellia sinensis]